MLAAQSCPILCDLMDSSPPGSSVPWTLQAIIAVGCYALLQGIFLTQELNWGLLHHRQTLYCLSHWGRELCQFLFVPDFPLILIFLGLNF